MECNKFKLAVAPQTAGQETLHPYFDDIEDDFGFPQPFLRISLPPFAIPSKRQTSGLHS
jgi:hypothetical protein